MGRKILSGLAAGCLLVIMAFVTAVPSAHAQMKDITLALDWMINGTHSPYYVAADKGYYKDAGFNVEIVRGYGSGDTVKKVAAKRATFGICDFATLVTSVIREKTPDKAVAAVYGKAMLGILYTKESGIKEPKDLEGKKLGRSASGASVNMFPAFIAANHLDRSKITEVVVDATSFLPMLLSGQVDAVLEQSIHKGRFQKAADEGGQKVTIMSMLYSDFGLRTYGNVIATNTDLIMQDPKMVKGFVQASLKGLAYAFKNPEEAVSIIAKINPQISKDRALEELLAVKATWSDDMLKAGLGYMTPEMTEISVDNIVKALNLQKPESIDLVYDNRFVK